MIFLPRLRLFIIIGIAFYLLVSNSVYARVKISNYPSTIVIDEQSSLILTGVLEPEMEYYFKVRIGKDSQSMNQAQTLNPIDGGSWLNDTNTWTSFPILSTDSTGSIIGPLSVDFKAKITAESGSNEILVETRNVTSESVETVSDVEDITILLTKPKEEISTESVATISATKSTSTPIPSTSPLSQPNKTINSKLVESGNNSTVNDKSIEQQDASLFSYNDTSFYLILASLGFFVICPGFEIK